MDNLNVKQARFVEEYLLDLNGTQAAIRAGYSAKTANVHASRLLTNASIQKRIAEQQHKRSSRLGITQDRVLLEIARLAFSDPRKAFDKNNNLLNVHDWPDEVAASISSIKVNEIKNQDGEIITTTKEVKFWDKSKNLDMAARHLGMYGEKQPTDEKPEPKQIVFTVIDASA